MEIVSSQLTPVRSLYQGFPISQKLGARVQKHVINSKHLFKNDEASIVWWVLVGYIKFLSDKKGIKRETYEIWVCDQGV